MGASMSKALPYVNTYNDRHGTRRVYFRRKGIRLALPSDTTSPEFAAAYARFLGAAEGGDKHDPATFTRAAARLYKSAKRRSTERGIVFDLSKKALLDLLLKHNGKCAVTGLPLDFRRFSLAGPGPYSPSLDRVKPSDGYTVSNVRVTCFAVNVALHAWGEDVLATIAAAFLKKRRAATFDRPPFARAA